MDEMPDFPPEEPRGDEPYWFEELRRDAAYAEWLKSNERNDDPEMKE